MHKCKKLPKLINWNTHKYAEPNNWLPNHPKNHPFTQFVQTNNFNINTNEWFFLIFYGRVWLDHFGCRVGGSSLIWAFREFYLKMFLLESFFKLNSGQIFILHIFISINNNYNFPYMVLQFILRLLSLMMALCLCFRHTRLLFLPY